MLLKIIVGFLVFMGVMSMFGSRSLPGMKYLDVLRCNRCDKLKMTGCTCDKKLDDKR